jgi:hypothetical protein
VLVSIFTSLLLTLILLTWKIWLAPNNASKWQMWFNSAFKGLVIPTRLLAYNNFHYLNLFTKFLKRLKWKCFHRDMKWDRIFNFLVKNSCTTHSSRYERTYSFNRNILLNLQISKLKIVLTEKHKTPAADRRGSLVGLYTIAVKMICLNSNLTFYI